MFAKHSIRRIAGSASLAAAAGIAIASPGASPDDKKPDSPPATRATSTPKPESTPVTSKPVKEVRENGLEIEDLVVGEGALCKPGSAVVAHYRGTFKSDGKQFDASYDRGEPIPFPLSGVIAGWQEGVPGMRVGGKRKLVIPYQLAYGEQGRPPRIPPKADLVFEIELVNVLQTEEIVEGTGKECKPNQTVRVFYTGTLKENGKQFDSNVGGEPIEFSLRSLIPGWQYGIPGMKVGGKRKLIIPWQFAYGEQGAPPEIPPRADLVFEIELLDVR